MWRWTADRTLFDPWADRLPYEQRQPAGRLISHGAMSCAAWTANNGVRACKRTC